MEENKTVVLDKETYTEKAFYEQKEKLEESGKKLSQISENEYVTAERLRG